MSIGRKQQLKQAHDKKLMDLYESYYTRAIDGDTQSLKSFIDVARELFGDEKEDKLSKILKGIKVEEWHREKRKS